MDSNYQDVSDDSVVKEKDVSVYKKETYNPSQVQSLKFPRPVYDVKTSIPLNYRGMTLIPNQDLNAYQASRSRKMRQQLEYDSFRLTKTKKVYESVIAMAEIECAQSGLRFDDIDQDVLNSTCAMGLKHPSHQMFEEFGSFGNTTDYVPKVDLNVIAKYLIDPGRRTDVLSNIDEDIKKGYALKRGTNQAYPWIVSGMWRFGSVSTLAINTLLANSVRKSKSFSSHDLMELMKNAYGDPFYVYFTRFQNTGKVVPMHTSIGSKLHTTNFEPRVRGVYAAPKVLTIHNRPVAKIMLKVLLGHKDYSQDPKIRHGWFVKNMPRQDSVVVAFDQSKFDQRHGKGRLKQSLDLIGLIAKMLSQSFIDDKMMTAVRLELLEIYTMLITNDHVYRGEASSILQSGASLTSIIGSFCNIIDFFDIMQRVFEKDTQGILELIDSNTIGHRGWGDDAIDLMPKDKLSKYTKVLAEGEKTMGLVLDTEPKIKFLGSYYFQDFNYKPTFSPGKGIQSVLFPERVKSPNALPLALVARINMLQQDDGYKRKYYQLLRRLYHGYLRVTEKHGVKSRVMEKSVMGLFTSPLMIKAVQNLPEDLKQLRTLTDDMLKNPMNYDIGTDFQAVDGVMNLLMHGLNGQIEASILGEDQWAKLSQISSVNVNENMSFDELRGIVVPEEIKIKSDKDKAMAEVMNRIGKDIKRKGTDDPEYVFSVVSNHFQSLVDARLLKGGLGRNGRSPIYDG